MNAFQLEVCPVCKGVGETPNRFIGKVIECWCCNGVGSVCRSSQVEMFNNPAEFQQVAA